MDKKEILNKFSADFQLKSNKGLRRIIVGYLQNGVSPYVLIEYLVESHSRREEILNKIIEE